jgi:hypothetical protein
MYSFKLQCFEVNEIKSDLCLFLKLSSMTIKI